MSAADEANEAVETQVGLGARISELRLKSSQSLQDVADAVGVSKAHIWELEKGRTDNPSMALVTRLADHFGVSIRYLVGEDVDADDADEELARMFRQASKLAPEDRAILDDMMQSMLKRRRSGNAR
jgi:transcriptional regulator with XRE-family HTH domain